MKRKILFFLIFLFVGNLIFAQDFFNEIEWIVTEDTQLKLYRNMGYKSINKNTEISPSELTFLESDTNYITYIYIDDAKGEINADKVIPKNSKELFMSELINSTSIILPYYNFDILQKKDRTIIKDMFYDTFQSLKGEWYTEQNCYEYLLEHSTKRQLSLKNAIIDIDANNQQSSWLFVSDIKRIINGYQCKGIMEYEYEGNIFINSPTKGPHTLLILFDGDYINVYEDTKDKLLMTYAITDEKTYNEFNNLILTGKCDLSKVTWPRHADGTSPYDNQIKPAKFNFENLGKENTTKALPTNSTTNVAVNKTMTAYENLKLRSGEATTTSVLTVMAAGTKVKILQLGKAENIDGINSNWVKVEVQKGAKDRDGKEIKAGTVGWCYGGYLKDTADTDSVKKKKK